LGKHHFCQDLKIESIYQEQNFRIKQLERSAGKPKDDVCSIPHFCDLSGIVSA
jgi:hypothetical protein